MKFFKGYSIPERFTDRWFVIVGSIFLILCSIVALIKYYL